jgi:hypothetical protein
MDGLDDLLDGSDEFTKPKPQPKNEDLDLDDDWRKTTISKAPARRLNTMAASSNPTDDWGG